MPDAVVVRRDKEKNQEKGKRTKEIVGAVEAREAEMAESNYCAWLYASQASCASRRTG